LTSNVVTVDLSSIVSRLRLLSASTSVSQCSTVSLYFSQSNSQAFISLWKSMNVHCYDRNSIRTSRNERWHLS